MRLIDLCSIVIGGRIIYYTPALQQLQWLPVKYRIIFKISTLRSSRPGCIQHGRLSTTLTQVVAYQSSRRIYPSIFNHFWDIAIYRWRVIDFQQSREVNERYYHILLSPGYAPGTIAIDLNVTRLERGFNACKTPCCIYPSIFNRFWDIASYWSKIAIFSYSTSV